MERESRRKRIEGRRIRGEKKKENSIEGVGKN